MAEIVGGMGISHTPSMGIEYDKGLANGFAPNWKLWLDGTRPMKQWLRDLAPDQIVVVYNDHLNQFSFEAYPTFAIGVAPEFPQADEGWGPRPLPNLQGDVDFGWSVTNWLVHNEFDMTVCQQLEVDHGVYSWFPCVFDAPWPAPVLPIAVNMLRTPLPTSRRLWKLGAALRQAIEAYPGDARVLVVATGGMSHQIVGQRFGMANEELDRFFLARLGSRAEELVAIPREELMRLGGTEAAELSLWFAMRGALSKAPREVYSYYPFPKGTGCGVIAFEE
jgi:hypothetical protein